MSTLFEAMEIFARVMQKPHGLAALKVAEAIATTAATDASYILLFREIAEIAQGEAPSTVAGWLKSGRAFEQMRQTQAQDEAPKPRTRKAKET